LIHGFFCEGSCKGLAVSTDLPGLLSWYIEFELNHSAWSLKSSEVSTLEHPCRLPGGHNRKQSDMFGGFGGTGLEATTWSGSTKGRDYAGTKAGRGFSFMIKKRTHSSPPPRFLSTGFKQITFFHIGCLVTRNTIQGIY
jgi:hypothetical protein